MSALNKPENFAGRVNYAAQVISAGRQTSRAFDNCFENDDGDEVAAALVRRAEKNERLKANLFRYISRETAEAAYERLRGVNLAQSARETRARRRAAFAADMARWAVEDEKRAAAASNTA